MYTSCVNCGGKVAEINQVLADCGKYKTKMKISKCGHQSVANVILNDTEAKEYRVTVFHEILCQKDIISAIYLGASD